MKGYVDKLVKENAKLVAKIEKLDLFIESKMYDIFGWEEQNRMKGQLAVMIKYSEILCERISASIDPTDNIANPFGCDDNDPYPTSIDEE